MNSAGNLCDAHATGGPACPTGTVTIKDGANLLDAGTFTLNSLGFFEDQPIQLSAGTHSIVAVYSGDNSFTGSTSATDTVTVTKATTTTTVAANPSSVVPGGKVALTATVNSPSNATSPSQEPTGTVQFFNGGTAFGTPVTVIGSTTSPTAQATATIPAAALPMGQNQITAQYVGDSNYSASISPAVTVTVAKASTTTTVAANPNSVAAGGTVALTATVNSPNSAPSPAPTGTVQFFNGGTPFSAPVTVVGSTTSPTAQATATIPAAALPNGQDQITAQYSGDSNFSGSTSPAITVSVGVPGITLSSSTGSINIPAAGQPGMQLVTVSATNGFTGSVTLNCAVTSSPSGAVSPPTCSFGTPGQNFTAPNMITLSSTNTSGNATMTVATTAAKGIVFKPASRPRGPNLFLLSEVGAFFACFFLLGISVQKRRSFVMLAMLFFAVVALGAGCGSPSSGGTSKTPATTSGAYTVTVTGTASGNVTAQTAVTVNVP
jgi:hypothetical protein